RVARSIRGSIRIRPALRWHPGTTSGGTGRPCKGQSCGLGCPRSRSRRYLFLHRLAVGLRYLLDATVDDVRVDRNGSCHHLDDCVWIVWLRFWKRVARALRPRGAGSMTESTREAAP